MVSHFDTHLHPFCVPIGSTTGGVASSSCATTSKSQTPPVPETADAVYAEAQKRYEAKQYLDARRLFDAFLSRYGSDSRAARAQYLIGEAYLSESKYASAIGAYRKVIDSYRKSEEVVDAMYKSGVAFFAIKYCSDARVFFQELLRIYPKTEWKKDASEQIQKINRDLKNKSVCSS